ncbi:alkaline phosphatase family protein [Sorangium sp. So ce118]
MTLPDYHGGSIVNLMASIAHAFGAGSGPYPPLRSLPPARLTSRNVVLLVIDGLGHSSLMERCGSGVLARHTLGRITSVFPTTTASAITTFLTGTAPQQHGVTGWFTYFRELGEVLTVLPYHARQGGAPPKIPADALFDVPPVFDRLDALSHIVTPAHIAHSAFNTAHQGKAQMHGYEELDHMLDTIARIVRQPGARSYTYAYWPKYDKLAHEHGVASREAVAHIAELDAAIAGLLARISGTGTTVIVTADHGFIDMQADRAIQLDAHPELARTLSLPLCGERRAAYCYVDASRRARFVEYVTAHLGEVADLKISADLVREGYFGLGPPHARLHERIGDYTLLMKEAALMIDWLPGEQRYSHIGVHGGLCDQEMYVPLIVVEA